MLHCPRCNNANLPNARFCAHCAYPLAASSGAPGQPPRVVMQPAARASVSPKILIVVILSFVMAAAVPIILLFVLDDESPGDVQGQVVSTGQPHGDYTLTPTSCLSGEHESFFGVWVTPDLVSVPEGDGFKGGLKILKEHTGEWSVYVESPLECESLNCKIRPLDASKCSIFDVNVENSNRRHNRIRVRRGHAKLRCDFDGEGTLSADLTFGKCY